jgi:peptidoglycan/xylan/chitin deacetylase (PgdA/CDA1 family)
VELSALKLAILMYHAIHPDRSVVSINPATFSRQMDWLFENQFQVLSLQKLIEIFTTSGQVPQRSVILTFDDGFQSIADYAAPVLAKYGFSATVFIVAGYCGKVNNWPGQLVDIPRWPLLSWQEIRDLERAGFEFGAHSFTHARLDQLTEEQLKFEIIQAKVKLQDELGHDITPFAYPYGRFSPLAKSLVQAHFKLACSTHLGLVGSNSDPYELERVEVLYLQPSMFFNGLDKQWFETYLWFRRKVRQTTARFISREWQ